MNHTDTPMPHTGTPMADFAPTPPSGANGGATAEESNGFGPPPAFDNFPTYGNAVCVWFCTQMPEQ